ncbi:MULTISPECIES: ATP-binding protein [Stenotrophomonas]|uniref:ATP-binding protein n=1 Tax=Stenotrophomonas lactitubi TaxID=2045214 RepID=A0AAW4GDS3_9GAMM|nr:MULTISPECIES: ATP-binding protein [Stenotrophomonas]MBM9912242.1 ATP-binding protein [Stenotrophomonas lactitubi]MBM9920720.1 ATP-binding protein [Stenotrophomonas lactitubi]MBM9937838.1 ATP-binding protein [Stenotrophomonas lactitubi]
MYAHDNVAAIRATYPDLLADHPLLRANAVLATPVVREAATLTFDKARRARSSVAFWAHPLSGKSSCIAALRKLAATQFPGCGFMVYEPSSKEVPAEGALIEDLLSEIGYEGRIDRTLTGKRNQIERALYSLAIVGRRLFFVIDEAQNLHAKELGWLKRLVNWLSVRDIKVTVVLFGQSQLCAMHDRLKVQMPDLSERFMSRLNEFRSLQDATDIRVCLRCCDEETEYPAGSGWSYTQYLWPRAYNHGFRLEKCANDMFEAFRARSGGSIEREGVSMQWIAEALMLVGLDAEASDADDLVLSRGDWERAIADSDYGARSPPALGTAGRRSRVGRQERA